jgi:hypothetical protein
VVTSIWVEDVTATVERTAYSTFIATTARAGGLPFGTGDRAASAARIEDLAAHGGVDGCWWLVLFLVLFSSVEAFLLLVDSVDPKVGCSLANNVELKIERYCEVEEKSLHFIDSQKFLSYSRTESMIPCFDQWVTNCGLNTNS